MVAIGLGTYRLGDDTLRVCRDAFELGYRHVDTAALYGNESAVGEAVRQSGLERSEFTVTSKVWVDDIRAGRIDQAVDRSVSLVGRIDAMLLHAPVGCASDLARSWDSLVRACERHGIPVVGVSNYRQEHLDALPTAPAVNQIEVTPFIPRQELVARCLEDGILVTAHSPLAKARRIEDPALDAIAIEVGHGCGREVSAAQLLLAWSVAKGLTPIPRSQSRQHLAENLAAAEIRLRPDHITQLDALADGYTTHPQHL